MIDLLIELVATCVVAVGGYKLKSLTFTGAIATVLVGSLVSLGFGYKGLILLGFFFATSSLWSKWKAGNKASMINKVEKGEQRDHIQVAANGGVAAIVGLLYFMTDSPIWIFMFVGSIAAATADTWASELGSLSKHKPILLTKLKRVDAGTSGAVSVLGTFAGLIGAFLIGLIAFFIWSDISLGSFLVLTLIGFCGNLIDTILGAYVQVVFMCPECGIETEKTVHCSSRTIYHKGISVCNNDVVNFISILVAAVLAGILL